MLVLKGNIGYNPLSIVCMIALCYYAFGIIQYILKNRNVLLHCYHKRVKDYSDTFLFIFLKGESHGKESVVFWTKWEW